MGQSSKRIRKSKVLGGTVGGGLGLGKVRHGGWVRILAASISGWTLTFCVCYFQSRPGTLGWGTGELDIQKFFRKIW